MCVYSRIIISEAAILAVVVIFLDRYYLPLMAGKQNEVLV